MKKIKFDNDRDIIYILGDGLDRGIENLYLLEFIINAFDKGKFIEGLGWL